MMNKKFNSIDIFVFFMIIVVLIGGIWYITKPDEVEAIKVANKVEMTFVADTDNIDKAAIQQIKVGDRLIANSGVLEAVITDIEVRDSEFLEAIEGEFVMIKDSEYKNLRITITGKVNQYGPYYELGGQSIKVGSTYRIVTNSFEAIGKVVQINE